MVKARSKEHVTRHKFAGDGYVVMEAEKGRVEVMKRERTKRLATAEEKRLRRRT
jgi:hypothetical protein